MGKTLVLHFLEKSKEKTDRRMMINNSLASGHVNETVDKQLGSPELFVSK